MPVYAFVCRECKKRFEVTEAITDYDRGSVACPKCKSKKVERVWGGVNVMTSKKS